MKKIFKTKTWDRIYIFIAVMIGVLTFSSCEKYLDIDKYIYDKITLDSIFVSKQKTIQYINGTAALLLDESKQYSIGSTFPFGATDEAIAAWVDWNHRFMYLLTDQVTPRDTKGFNMWGTYYKGIRKANIILARLGENKELSDIDRRDLTGRAYFLRAYFYYSLMRMYGPVVIVPNTAIDSDAEVSSASFERSSYDDCVEYVCNDLQKAADYLPVDREEANQFLPTKGAALAVMARMRLYAASPLFNGNTYYSDWLRSDGKPYISQVQDKSKWGKAAVVYKQIIDLKKYQLNITPIIISDKGTGTLPLPATVSKLNFPYGAGDIDPYKSYKTVFDGNVLPSHNKELIYFCNRNGNDDDWICFTTKQGGIAGFSVTQDMIDAYRMADGRQYSEATDAEKSADAVGTGMTFSDDYQLSPDRARMHDNREPRFYASIGFNYCVWPASAYTGTDPIKNLVVNYYKDGNSMPSGNYVVDYNRTGYTSRKYINQEDTRNWPGFSKPKIFPTFRYAEVLLGYVEAMNEMEGSYTDEATQTSVTKNVADMVFYFNQIRYRAGLPGITQADASDYEKMKSLIKQERQVEFAFENQRYFDLRRWKDAYNAINKPVTGMDVSANMSERSKFYTVRVWNTDQCTKRLFKNKMNFYPIDQSVLDKNGKLVQNPGW
ncbi:MAG: RagB/SusD family nutrient uptake outer membrane protein [Bacteroidota bacterium]|nr:RagB/SusD family nutrient uptake outer membrane protein [Bacteroidota bacterium]